MEGHIGLRLLPSLNSSVVSSWELSTASTSAINVVTASPFKLVPCVLSSDDKMFLADFICCSHTPPYDLQLGCFWSKPANLLHFPEENAWFCLVHFLKYPFWVYSVPTKLLPLPLLMLLILPLPAIILRSASINESASIVASISMWAALLTRHVNKAQYLFSSLCLSFTRNSPKRSTSQ